jgi:hypothetical protein
MKTKLGVLTVAVLSFCLAMGPSAMAFDLSINVGDRPYYTYGPSYWDNGYEWVWVEGHPGEHHHWIHGHYERRGEFRKEYAHKHHFRADHDHDRDH